MNARDALIVDLICARGAGGESALCKSATVLAVRPLYQRIKRAREKERNKDNSRDVSDSDQLPQTIHGMCAHKLV